MVIESVENILSIVFHSPLEGKFIVLHSPLEGKFIVLYSVLEGKIDLDQKFAEHPVIWEKSKQTETSLATNVWPKKHIWQQTWQLWPLL